MDSPTQTGLVYPAHAVHFYGNTESLHERVSEFLAEGAARGEIMVAIATSETCAAIRDHLGAKGFDTESARRRGLLHLEDAVSHLDRFMMADGHPDPARFGDQMGGILDRALGKDNVRRARIFGEMVDLLVRRRDTEAAYALEELWNRLAHARPHFSLVCGCSLAALDRAEDGAAVEALSERHAAVIAPGPSIADDDGAVSARELVLLRQRAQALEAEVRRREALEHSLRGVLEARRRSKDEAERANAAKSRFLTVVSHELRTPLTAIVGYQDLLDLELKGPINAEQRQFLNNIRSAAQQALGLMEQLLSLSRIESGEEIVELERFEPAMLVTEAAALIEPEAREKGLELDVRLDELPGLVRTDPMKLRQVLLNLLSNAVKFTREGRIELAAATEGDSLVFQVSDTGIGIDEADQDRIFEHFARLGNPGASQRGIGLGLALSREFAALLHGALTVESVPGEGSTFRLRIPIDVESRKPREEAVRS